MDEPCIDLLEIVNSIPHSVVLSSDQQTIFFSFSNLRGQNPRPFRLNRFIFLDSLVFECMGLWFGDGTKGNIGLVNTEVELLAKFREFFKMLGVSPSLLNVRVCMSEQQWDSRGELADRLSSDFDVSFSRITFSKLERRKPIITLFVSSVSFSKFFLAAIFVAAFFLFGCIQPGDLAGEKQGSAPTPTAIATQTTPAPTLELVENEQSSDQPPALPEDSGALAQEQPPALPSDEPGAATQSSETPQSDQLPQLPSEEVGESASITPPPSLSADSATPTPDATSDELPQIPV